MLSVIRNSFITKLIAVFLLLCFLTELLQPLQLMALTGGPSQPEMAGFTPMNTENMVDLFSGDFHYTIPIMTVPGPNGGFPINLTYTSGSGMEHEASWVGLGWNLNPGAINRQVRGVPDDFNGEEISKDYKRRDNNTFLFSPGGGGEVFGADFGIGLSMTNSFIYNTYSGISLCRRFGISASYVREKKIEDKKNAVSLSANIGININQDSENGVTTSFSMNGGSKNLKTGFNYGYNSKSGTYTYGNQISLNFSFNDRNVTYKKDGETKSRTISNGVGGSVGHSFSTAANLPPIHLPLTSTSWGVSSQLGGSGAFLEGYVNVNCNIVSQKTPNNPVSTPAYGLLYAENADSLSLQDYNREKELCVNKHSKNLPLPVMTNDIYSISGELMGGSFRAYRSDYGHFHDNKIETHTYTTDGGVDVGFGGGIQIGTNLSFTAGNTSSGDWRAGDYCSLLSFKGKAMYNTLSSKSITPTLYEPFYFKMSGEQTASDLGYMSEIGGEDAVSFPVTTHRKQSFWGGESYTYTINNQLSSNTINHFEQARRTRRTTNIEYRTGDSGNGRRANHIREFSIVNANGERHTYGKTLYNHVEKEVQFSIPFHGDIDSTVTNSYAAGNADGTQRVGKEKLYSCTVTPAYAYSYLLTQITSADYVDINNNGTPDDSDLGYWVKISYTDKYTHNSPYKWRFPYKGANYFMGDRSNQSDDIGSYNYGAKEIAYVKTIETKTHKAFFYISERKDALGVSNELRGGMDYSQKLYKLDSICLYSKEDTSIPIKTAVFVYDYSLCPGVPNNASNGGKLTLKSVYFKYALSEKGEQNPYIFHYSDFNPPYNASRMDRWGYYKENANYFEHYVTQDKSDADTWARAWLLVKIDLPEGGSIAIDYESDDYAHVQDRQAMFMAEIDSQTSFNKEEDGNYYIYFRKEQNVPAWKYVTGFKHNLMYFKMAVSYDNFMSPDYIQGYVEVNPANVTDCSATTGKVEVKAFPAYDIHPIYFLALQYLKNNRPDLMFNNADALENQNDASAFFRALLSGGIIDKVTAMYGNNAFYRHCLNNRYYFYPKTGEAGMSSYVRLNVTDGFKFGGGCRVKAITLGDNWTKSDTAHYRQEYYYKKNENGRLISSGVAEYEPTVGAEETALRYPVYDKVKGLYFIEDEMYSEEPYGESYFPAANVGYSQVIVKTYTPENVNLATAGIQRHEFYTARDFPIVVNQTPIEIKVNPVPNVFNLITAGFKQASTSAYSQGYSIELNDMHGKPKSSSTCPFIPLRDESALISAVENSGYTSKVEYFYQTKYENGIRKIDNRVDVLTGDGLTEKAIIGQTYDFVIDQRENFSQSIGGGASAQLMVGSYYPPTVGVSAMPSFDCFEELIRSIAVTKVIYKTGILKETKAYNNGSVITTRNLQYDPYTGQPLLTSATNEFEQPVYNYSMPAYWYHSNMGSAAENYRARFFQNPTPPDTRNTFGRYDRIPSNNTAYATIDTIFTSLSKALCWIYHDTSTIDLTNKEIIRSRYSNQFSAIASSVTSLTNPADPNNRRLPILAQFNSSDTTCFLYKDCAGNSQYARVYYDCDNHQLYFFVDDYPDKLCTLDLSQLLGAYQKHVVFNVFIPDSLQITNCEFIKSGDLIYVRKRNTHEVVASFGWSDPKGYFSVCLDGVLQASATEYKPKWSYDFDDAGASIPPPNQLNYLGIPNIYRPIRSNLYVTQRNQTGTFRRYETNAAYDGTFTSFMFFNHTQGNAENLQRPWLWTSEITKYSPFNFEIENVNALGIYSAALYGYKNSLATAVANNARYNEIGFDSFENDANIAAGSQRGHIRCMSGTISAAFAHTGKNSLKTNRLLISTSDSSKLHLQEGKSYVFSCWVRKPDCPTTGNLGDKYHITYGGDTLTFAKETKVNCWQRIEVPFTATNTNSQLTLTGEDGNYFYVDDIRIMPANATMKTYVYDPSNYRLVAELDESNFATLYNYDEEGVLVQIKKETELGIRTIKTTRQFHKKHTF